MTEGFPATLQTDLRYYTGSDGRFTTALRAHYEPFRRRSDRQVFVKVGPTWAVLPFDLLRAGMVFRLLEDDNTFVTWADDGTTEMFAMTDATKSEAGVWGVRTRKPTKNETEEA